MSYLGLNPEHDDNERVYASEHPGEFAPGFFDGVVTAPLKGLYGGLVAKPALAVGSAVTEAVTPAAQYIDQQLDTTAVEDFLANQKKLDIEAVRANMPDPQTTGTAGQILNSLADVGSEGIAGTLIGGPQGAIAIPAALQGIADYELSVADGMNETTAFQKALITGGTTALGAALPVKVGIGKLPNLGFSIGSNVTMGIAQRGLTADALRSGGYDEMAQHYDALDAQSVVIDGILGTVFGAVGTLHNARTGDPVAVKPSDIDAALTANNAIHAERDSPPGIPADPRTLSAHVRALEKAIMDVNVGRPVDITAIMQDANFVSKKLDTFLSDMHYLANEFYPDIPYRYSDDVAIAPQAIEEQITSLEQDVPLLMSIKERKRMAGEIHDLQYGLEQELNKLESGYEYHDVLAERQVKKGPGTSDTAEIEGARQTLYKKQVKEINNRISQLKQEIDEKQAELDKHLKGGRYYDARNNIDKLKKGEIPESLKESLVQRSHDIYRAQADMAAETLYSQQPIERVKAERQEKITDENAVNLATEAIEESDLTIPYEDDEGNMKHVSAKAIMDELDNEIKQAKEDSNLFQTAIQCFLGGSQ